MSFLELAKKRYSVRSYEEKKVETEKVQLILEAGRVAPTAANVQPQRFLVIDTPEGLLRLSKGTRSHGAPLAIIILGDLENVWIRPYDRKKMIDIDTSIVTDHMMLEATDLGLGTCWLTYFDPKIIREEFHIPPTLEPVSILMIGYAHGQPLPVDRHDRVRKPLSEITFYQTF